MLYMVECGFSDPKLEDDWNAFYSGPKLADLLNRVPGFRRSQRFREVGPSDAPYIAIHEVVSAELLSDPSYFGAGGGSFLQWQDYITNWRRTIFSGLDRLPPVGPDEILVVIDEAPRPVTALEVDWLEAAGLDNRVPSRGVAITGATKTAEIEAELGTSARIFVPISEQMIAPE
ncbi:hypothetical protein [Salipiger sp.]|uniref:hypothetical protein n=1 Tax=Salipiger sp. TaxID=2078585 RepID=UPI003A97F4AE